MFEGFPYTNFHELNTDWIIKIAKDFLDQYTHIQETIDNGLTALDEKADALQALLDEWYNEHSQDIADQLADALQDLNDWYTEHSNDIANLLTAAMNDFDVHADQKAAEAIETIPSDYTELNMRVLDMENEGTNLYKLADKGAGYVPDLHWYQETASGTDGHVAPSNAQIRCQIFYVGTGNYIRLTPDSGYLTHVRWYNTPDLTSFVSSTNNLNGWITAPADWLIVALTTSDYGNITVSAASHVLIRHYPLKNYPLQGTLYTIPNSPNPETSVQVDLVNMIITFGNSTSGTGRVYLRTKRKVYQVGTKTVNIVGSFCFIYFNSNTEEFVCVDAGDASVRQLNSDYIYVGSIWDLESHVSVNLNVIPFYYVNGAITYSNDFRGTFDSLRTYGNSAMNIAVLGDSTSTFDGISEDTIGGRSVRGAYYPHDTLTDSSQMWWAKLQKMLRFGGAINVSAVSRSRYLNDIDTGDIYAPAVWNTERIARLQQNSNYPHYIFIVAGINDGYSTNVYGEFSYTNDITEIEAEPETIARGIELTIRRVQNANPAARIVLIIPYNVKLNTSNFNWKSFYKTCELIKQIGEAYGVFKIIDLRECEIREGNIGTYTFDGTHPNEKGMTLIAAYIYNCLTDDNRAIRT